MRVAGAVGLFNPEKRDIMLMYKIDPREINQSMIRMIGDDWMLVSAGTEEKFNTMTASWGGVGFLWNKPVAFVFVRPQRYTFEFTEQYDTMTLSFFDAKYRTALTICGTNSGRDMDKVAMAKLTPWYIPGGNVAFEEASLVLEGRKLYAEPLDPAHFVDRSIPGQWYPSGDFHKMYVVEIVNAWKNN